MRIYSNAYELMSETGRNLWEMGLEVKPKTYQNQIIEDNDDFVTKELICEQYCLTHLDDANWLFIHTNSQQWAHAELEERLMGYPLNPGNAWKLRKDVWEQFLVDGKFDYTYSERMYYAIEPLIELLIEDHDTRKAVLPIFNSDTKNKDTEYYDGSKRIPCSMYYDFLIRKNANGEEQLNICYHQRSSDFITHFGNDVYLAWFTMVYIANRVKVKPGYLYHTIDSLHAYKKDWDKLKSSIGEMKRK